VWAIGTGKVATPAIAQDIHAYIRTWLHTHYGEDAASKVSIRLHLIHFIALCVLYTCLLVPFTACIVLPIILYVLHFRFNTGAYSIRG